MPKRDRQCGGKVRHPTKGAAIGAARRAVNVGMNVYLCHRCKGWHIGKTRDPLRSADRITALLKHHAKKHSKPAGVTT